MPKVGVFNVSSLLAKHWGVEEDSSRFKKRMRDMRERAKGERYEIVPCGPACNNCGDNSHVCGCNETTQDPPPSWT